MLYGQFWQKLKEMLRDLARKKESGAAAEHVQLDSGRMLIAIPLRGTVFLVIGRIKGKSASHRAWTYLGSSKNEGGLRFGARSYYVSTVGTDKNIVRFYIGVQKQEDQRIEQLHVSK